MPRSPSDAFFQIEASAASSIGSQFNQMPVSPLHLLDPYGRARFGRSPCTTTVVPSTKAANRVASGRHSRASPEYNKAFKVVNIMLKVRTIVTVATCAISLSSGNRRCITLLPRKYLLGYRLPPAPSCWGRSASITGRRCVLCKIQREEDRRYSPLIKNVVSGKTVWTRVE